MTEPLPLELSLSLSMHEPMLSLSMSMHEPMLSLSLSMHEPMLSLSMLVLDPNFKGFRLMLRTLDTTTQQDISEFRWSGMLSKKIVKRC